jgi:lipoprotein-anchoring transpeptidase ErfK/SrfK
VQSTRSHQQLPGDGYEIEVSISTQQLLLRRGKEVIRSYPISSSRFGLGTEEGSRKTPLGKFQIAEKIGHGMPPGTVFRARVPLAPGEPMPDTEDFITSRILWLDGLDPENSNTKERFIYIHGTRHEHRIGRPDSHGCIRMKNSDVIELFDLVPEGTIVRITG